MQKDPLGFGFVANWLLYYQFYIIEPWDLKFVQISCFNAIPLTIIDRKNHIKKIIDR